jgi:hypothetical protein
MQTCVFTFPPIIKKVHFSNVRRVCLIPSRDDLMDANLINELWWTPQDRANFRKEATVETAKEYFKLSIEERNKTSFNIFTKQYWFNYEPPETLSLMEDLSMNIHSFLKNWSQS